mmetsp:Transcript_37762/g.99857  ORF Transcript_37762/g.99857 Transcript_37762/m.99857 type:complete len:467 (+) Transcript_37762:124-1524(+)
MVEVKNALLARAKTHSKMEAGVSKSQLAALTTNAVVQTVASAEEMAKLQFWQQGDASMYSFENVEQRYQNRFDSDVLHLINTYWWPTCLRAMPIAAWDGDAHRTWTVPQENYVLMISKISKALLEADGAWNEEEARILSEEAWVSDTHGTGKLTRTLFCDSIFEVADMWTISVACDECVRFLTRLFEAVGREELDRWKSYDAIRSLMQANAPPKVERLERRVGHRRRRAAVVIQKHGRRKGGARKFGKRLQSAVHIQSHARRRRDQHAFSRKKAAAVKIQSISRRMHAMKIADGLCKHVVPNLKQPPRYLLPRARPPTRLLDRQKQVAPQVAPRSKSMSVMDIRRPLPVIREAPNLIPPVHPRPSLRRRATEPRLTMCEIQAPSVYGSLRTGSECSLLRTARDILDGEFRPSPRDLATSIRREGGRASSTRKLHRMRPIGSPTVQQLGRTNVQLGGRFYSLRLSTS